MFKKIPKAIFWVAVLGMGYALYMGLVDPYWFPRELAGLRVIEEAANTVIVNHADATEEQIDEVIETPGVEELLLSKASEVGQKRNFREALLARADNRVPHGINIVVEGQYQDWTDIGTPVAEVLRFTSYGRICSTAREHECSNSPNGIYFDGLPQEHGSKELVIPGKPMHGLIGLIQHKNGRFGTPFYMGADCRVDPNIHGSGKIWLWTNGIHKISNLYTRADFLQSAGHYVVGVEPTEGAAVAPLCGTVISEDKDSPQPPQQQPLIPRAIPILTVEFRN